jgi:hypothetical protein
VAAISSELAETWCLSIIHTALPRSFQFSDKNKSTLNFLKVYSLMSLAFAQLTSKPFDLKISKCL